MTIARKVLQVGWQRGSEVAASDLRSHQGFFKNRANLAVQHDQSI
jgi:hypothetical protein